MYKLSIIKNAEVTNYATFETMEELNSWFESQKENKSFGENTWDEVILAEDGVTVLNTIHHVADYTYTIEDITAQVTKEARRNELLELGRMDKQKCDNALLIIGGINRDRVLTADQINQMQSQFGTIETLLKSGRPTTAKSLVQALTPDGDLITQEMKELVTAELT